MLKKSQKLLFIRNELGLTQKEMASKLNIPQSYYSSLERGIKSLSSNVINTMIEALNVSYDWYTTGVGEPFIKQNAPFQAHYSMTDLIQRNVNDFELSPQLKKYLNKTNNIIDCQEFLYYYKHPTMHIKALYEELLADYKKALNSLNDIYEIAKLLSITKEGYYGPKFSYIDIDEFLKEETRELKEEVEDFTNDKDFLIIQIILIKYNIEHYSNIIPIKLEYLLKASKSFKSFGVIEINEESILLD